MSYEFRVLGPVGWETGGEFVSPGPPKRQAVLAALLLEANRPVPVTRLAAAAWPGPPPRSAAVNLRGHVSQLRRAVGHRLRFHRGGYGGYELQVEDAELDAARFVQLATAGRAALAGGQPAVALVRLGQALGLWRGTARDGLPRGTWLDARFEEMDQQRLAAFEDHVTARLHTREFPGIAAALRRHLISWPIRERSWELLMLALYRSGDPPAALAAYRQARGVLIEQLGVEPGPQLQRLHRAVLRRDQSLDGPPEPRQAAAISGPDADPADGAQRRSPPQRTLVGRADERWALAAALREHPPAVIVCGPAGVGKSALAFDAITAVADAFPDGQVTINLASSNSSAPLAAADVLDNVRRVLGVSLPGPVPRTVTELATRYHAMVAGQRMLVVLDGAADAEQVRPLMSDSGPTVLVTSRRRGLGLAGAPRLQVDRLTHRQALDLLTWYAGAVRTGEPDPVRELVRICDGLPLALRIVGQWLASHPGLPAGLLATHLARRPLDGLRAGNLSVRDALAADLRTVADDDPLATRVFPLLADGYAHPIEAVAAELGEDPSLVFFALERLVDQWLVSSPQPGRYRTAGLPRAYAAEMASRE
jgi:DNA-binding SARP family transcriptional activator